MPGPKTKEEVKKWVHDAIMYGLYTPSVHFKERCVERRTSMTDVHHILQKGRRIEPYPGMPKNGGSCWRISGFNTDGDRQISIGIEAFCDQENNERIILCTVMEQS
jgi:hypothetical protein